MALPAGPSALHLSVLRLCAAAQIVAITTLANVGGAGGFFPTGYHGTINGTRGSLGSSQYLPL